MISGITVKNKKILYGGVSVTKLEKYFGTPLFVFSEQRLIDNFKALSNAFTKHYANTFIYYSVKTNSELGILKTLNTLGSRAEVASGLEVLIALKAGFKPSEIIADGPAWSDSDIELFIRRGLHTLNVDSMDLMERVNKIARKLNKRVRVTFRIFPQLRISLLKNFVENYISKFGVPASDGVEAFTKIKKFSNIVPVGISAHIGSMITDPSFYEKAIDVFTNLAAKLSNELGIKIEEINIGGGFGLQSLNYYAIHNLILEKAGIAAYEKAASIEEFGKKITTRFKSNLTKNNLTNINLILEPGRFMVSDAGVLLTKIVAKKSNWIFLDGGINLIPESIFFIRRGFLVEGKVGTRTSQKFNIAGPTLNTADVLATNQALPPVEVGETVVILDAGAYSLTRSNQFTLLRPPVIYIKSDGKIKFLRKQESPKEILDKML